ncbi:hypothetical protein [Halosimplex pelagicum]|uniref:Uncharacterized protein n=1 Tax=Halosimplex pelagicum TaxID=869886 RepID=A0A7D5TH44_9EURY|nr:hypothetical protein [Halosimplex pelagicum]QLH82456.1 hypothetical protein HZS54_12900 [Halosimplex pelagicum]QLH82512.1 hypothetical protein HZS54_13205 [Halosimplex pelagicum]
MADPTWMLSLREADAGSDTDVVVNGTTGDIVEAVPGRQETATLLFSSPVDGEPAARQRFETARQLLEFAHTGARGRDDDGVPWYRERLPAAAPVDSQVVRLAPSVDVAAKSFRGVWAVVVGGQAANQTFSPRLQLDLFVLADEDDYADRSAVEDALGEVL